MNKLHKNQNGFTVIEVLLLLIFLALIGFIGYYVYHSQHTTTATTTNSGQATPPASTKTSTTPNPTTKANTSQDAVSFVQATYNKYITAEQPAVNSTNSQPTGAEGLPAVENSMTPALYSSVTSKKGGTGFACSPTQSVPSSVTTALSSSTASQAIVVVSVSGSPSESVTVDLASLKMTAIDCLNQIP